MVRSTSYLSRSGNGHFICSTEIPKGLIYMPDSLLGNLQDTFSLIITEKWKGRCCHSIIKMRKVSLRVAWRASRPHSWKMTELVLNFRSVWLQATFFPLVRAATLMQGYEIGHRPPLVAPVSKVRTFAFLVEIKVDSQRSCTESKQNTTF